MNEEDMKMGQSVISKLVLARFDQISYDCMEDFVKNYYESNTGKKFDIEDTDAVRFIGEKLGLDCFGQDISKQWINNGRNEFGNKDISKSFAIADKWEEERNSCMLKAIENRDVKENLESLGSVSISDKQFIAGMAGVLEQTSDRRNEIAEGCKTELFAANAQAMDTQDAQ